jgi:hypothetical protein
VMLCLWIGRTMVWLGCIYAAMFDCVARLYLCGWVGLCDMISLCDWEDYWLCSNPLYAYILYGWVGLCGKIMYVMLSRMYGKATAVWTMVW